MKTQSLSHPTWKTQDEQTQLRRQNKPSRIRGKRTVEPGKRPQAQPNKSLCSYLHPHLGAGPDHSAAVFACHLLNHCPKTKLKQFSNEGGVFFSRERNPWVEKAQGLASRGTRFREGSGQACWQRPRGNGVWLAGRAGIPFTAGGSYFLE